jgi:hypothetical protein
MRATWSTTSCKPADEDAVKVYTAVQLFELALFAAVVLYSVLAHLPSLTVLGAGLLVGKALLNIVAPEGGTVLRRSVIGYGVGALYVLVALVLIHFNP